MEGHLLMRSWALPSATCWLGTVLGVVDGGTVTRRRHAGRLLRRQSVWLRGWIDRGLSGRLTRGKQHGLLWRLNSRTNTGLIARECWGHEERLKCRQNGRDEGCWDCITTVYCPDGWLDGCWLGRWVGFLEGCDDGCLLGSSRRLCGRESDGYVVQMVVPEMV